MSLRSRLAIPAGLICAGLLSLSLTAQITIATANPPIISVVVGQPEQPRRVPATLFGAFLEPIGDSMNHGLSAEILTNPSLESGLWNHANLEKLFAARPELIDASNHFGLPLPWEPLDPQAGRRFELHYGDAANSWQSLEIMGVAGHEAGIMQQVYLPVHRTLSYTVSFYAKHLEGPPQITLLFREHGRVVTQARVSAGAPEWKRYSAVLTLPQGAVAPLESVEFAVKVSPEERVDLDELSVMPADAIDGLDPEVVQMAAEMGMTELRLSGNFSSNYHWRDGIGPADKRLAVENSSWGIPEYNKFGTEEFLSFCRKIDVVPQFGLNMGSGTPEEAAGWVRYIRLHYHQPVIYELGNELYGRWQVGWIPIEQIASRTLAFSQAVRAVAPHATIIATGGTPLNFEQWNAQQLTNPPGTFNDLSTHFIHQTNQDALTSASPDFMAAAAYALPFELGRRLERMQAQVDAVPAHQGQVHFAMTEWLFNSRGKGERVFTNDSPNSTNQGGAVMAAGVFNTLIRTSPIVNISNMTGLMEFAGIWKRREQVYATPSYYIFKIYSRTKNQVILPVRTNSGTYDVQGGIPGFENVEGVPYLDTVATMRPDGSEMTLFCINRDTSHDLRLRIDPGTFRHNSTARIEQVKAASRYAVNNEENPTNITPQTSTLTIAAKGAFEYTLPRESVTVIHLAGQSSRGAH